MVPLDDHLHAFFDLGQHRVGIASEFGFADVERPHIHDDRPYFSVEAAGGGLKTKPGSGERPDERVGFHARIGRRCRTG
jgi:hypothetical protein